jgi:gamma-glutamylcyclotransferase (GGCT)/AIG2-like uncharacterized protein YtfP
MYAAYGSNLNHEQMAIRCPQAKFIQTGILKDYQLVFRGVADIEWNLHSSVLVGLWEITDDCLLALDRYEGYPRLYGRDVAEIQIKTGEIDALIYYMNDGEYYPPMESYYQSILKGYKHCGLPVKKLEADLNKFINMYASKSQWWQQSKTNI